MRSFSKGLHAAGKTIALVPTMGALHRGHLSLIERARKSADVCVVSIFVNPIQFGPSEDFRRYPRDPRGDARQLKRAGVDALFAPRGAAIYPAGFSTSVHVSGVTETLCGPKRPGHFDGVATVVLKLFQLVEPDVAVFGLKDFQQTAVIRTMIRDLDLPVRLLTGPTIRESDGLAMSSRNARLAPAQRRVAPALFRGLAETRRRFKRGERRSSILRGIVRRILERESMIRIEYVSLVEPETLKPLGRASSGSVVAVACRIGGIRLIDNIILR